MQLYTEQDEKFLWSMLDWVDGEEAKEEKKATKPQLASKRMGEGNSQPSIIEQLAKSRSCPKTMYVRD